MEEISEFAGKLSEGAGISELMKDLGLGLAQAREQGLEIAMMGGGNPAHIPEAEKMFRTIWDELARDRVTLNHILGDYSGPRGDESIRRDLAVFLSTKLSSNIEAENIVFTPGSQSAFFLLFNVFAGRFRQGNFKKILLPITPEYIGYADQGIEYDMFASLPPLVKKISENRFSYLPDIARVETRLKEGDIGALCLSRPTNPSGNVIPWDSLLQLFDIAERFSIPFILDNAYGYPFPNILFQDPAIQWKPGMIHVLSLSKLGLPGLRTGIIIADKKIASIIAEMVAVQNLSPGNVGAHFLKRLLQGDRLSDLSSRIIQPYYKEKSDYVQNLIDERFKKANIHYSMHENHGALFLWVRFPGHKKNSEQIYREAKNQGLFLIPGHWFFPGIEETFSHQNDCIRLTYSSNLQEVSRGIDILTRILT